MRARNKKKKKKHLKKKTYKRLESTHQTCELGDETKIIL
jgi:hypothetical protein